MLSGDCKIPFYGIGGHVQSESGFHRWKVNSGLISEDIHFKTGKSK